MVRNSAIASACLTLLACGGTTGSPPPQPDADLTDPPDAMPGNLCPSLETAYGDLGAFTGEAVVAPTNPDIPDGRKFLTMEMPLNAEAPPDVFFLELWGDSAPFEDGFVPITFALNGDHSDLILCGACAYIAPDHEEGADKDFHMAYSGELELTAVDPTPDTGVVQGTLRDVKMHQVFFDSNNVQQTAPDGCKTEIAELSFDFTVVAAPEEAP